MQKHPTSKGLKVFSTIKDKVLKRQEK